VVHRSAECWATLSSKVLLVAEWQFRNIADVVNSIDVNSSRAFCRSARVPVEWRLMDTYCWVAYRVNWCVWTQTLGNSVTHNKQIRHRETTDTENQLYQLSIWLTSIKQIHTHNTVRLGIFVSSLEGPPNGSNVVVIMSPLRRHIFVCFMAKGIFFGPSSVKRGRTHIVLGWNMSCASISTYPENLGSVGLLPAELRGRVCLFCLFVCPSRSCRSTVYGHQQGKHRSC